MDRDWCNISVDKSLFSIVLMRIFTDSTNNKKLQKCLIMILYCTTVANPESGVTIDQV